MTDTNTLVSKETQRYLPPLKERPFRGSSTQALVTYFAFSRKAL
jgi:hypothetical protein